MYSVYKLNKQGDNIHPWCTLFPILNKSIVSCLVLTIAFDLHKEAIKMVWYSHILKNFPEFAVIHTGKDFSIVNEAEADIFLEFSCFSMIQLTTVFQMC